MPRLSRPDLVIAVAVAAILVAAALAGVPRTLGAHPWWARETGIVGGLGGAVLWLVLRGTGAGFAGQLTVSLLALLAAAAAAHFGKQVFAASLAENTAAGRFWYFGWFALSGSAALLLATVAARVLRR